MADLTPGQRKALAYWGPISSAVSQGADTRQVWSAIRSAADDLGLASPGVSARDVSTIRGYATAIARTARDIARLSDDLGIGNLRIPQAPWGRSLAEQDALKMHQVTFQHTTVTSEGEQTVWRSSVFTGSLPGTIGELRAQIEADANEIAIDYDEEHVGVGAIQIMAI